MAQPLYLRAEDVRACLSDEEIFDVVASTMRKMGSADVVLGPTEVFAVERDGVRNRMGSMSGCLVPEAAAGLKWFFVPGTERPRDVPHVPATILICDARTGQLDGLLDGTELTCARTAAMGVAAALACARRRVEKAAVVGAGHIGRAAAKFLAGTAGVESIAIASRTERSALEVCQQVRAGSPRPCTMFATADIRRAVADADLVITATSVTTDHDIVRASWLQSDAIVCSLGSYREVDLELVSDSWMIVHDVEHVRQRRADLREGGAGWGRVAGDVASVMSGRLRPPAGKSRIYIVVGSIGVLDVALGARALANARRLGVGIALG